MTKLDFNDWKAHPITEDFFAALEMGVEELRAFLGDGNTLGELSEQRTAAVVGKIAALTETLNIKFEDLYPEVDESND